MKIFTKDLLEISFLERSSKKRFGNISTKDSALGYFSVPQRIKRKTIKVFRSEIKRLFSFSKILLRVKKK